jgi:hypothetical protein
MVVGKGETGGDGNALMRYMSLNPASALIMGRSSGLPTSCVKMYILILVEILYVPEGM